MHLILLGRKVKRLLIFGRGASFRVLLIFDTTLLTGIGFNGLLL